MSAPAFMQLYPADYLNKTRRLSTIQHGIYMLLIMEYWTHDGLPDDDAQLAQICGLQEDEWLRHKPVIAQFFEDGWRHERIDEELAKARQKSVKRGKAGSDGAAKRWSNLPEDSKPIANEWQMPSDCHSKPMANASQTDSKPIAFSSDSTDTSLRSVSAASPEKELFEEGKRLLGAKAGGVIANLLKACDGDVIRARGVIADAGDAQDPREYVHGVIRAGPKRTAAKSEPRKNPYFDGLTGRKPYEPGFDFDRTHWPTDEIVGTGGGWDRASSAGTPAGCGGKVLDLASFSAVAGSPGGAGKTGAVDPPMARSGGS